MNSGELRIKNEIKGIQMHKGWFGWSRVEAHLRSKVIDKNGEMVGQGRYTFSVGLTNI